MNKKPFVVVMHEVVIKIFVPSSPRGGFWRGGAVGETHAGAYCSPAVGRHHHRRPAAAINVGGGGVLCGS